MGQGAPAFYTIVPGHFLPVQRSGTRLGREPWCWGGTWRAGDREGVPHPGLPPHPTPPPAALTGPPSQELGSHSESDWNCQAHFQTMR